MFSADLIVASVKRIHGRVSKKIWIVANQLDSASVCDFRKTTFGSHEEQFNATKPRLLHTAGVAFSLFPVAYGTLICRDKDSNIRYNEGNEECNEDFNPNGQ
jgi:hypothetical protein